MAMLRIHSYSFSQIHKMCFSKPSFDNKPTKLMNQKMSRNTSLSCVNDTTTTTTIPEPLLKSQDPLTKEDLVHYLSSGCKPKDQWRIGVEHEKFAFELGSLSPLRYDQIANLFDAMADKFGWERVMEDHNIIGLKKGNQSVSLEGGGQVEFSGAPLKTLHHTCAEIDSHLREVKAVAKDMGIGFIGTGFEPKCKEDDLPIVPKVRFDVVKKYLTNKFGASELDIMCRSSSIQVNLDFSSELDMVKKFQVSIALQPIANALLANSPFVEGKPSGYLSFRCHSWANFEKSRTGMLPFVFHDSFGFEKYVNYAIDVPIMVIRMKDKCTAGTGGTFRDFMAGNLKEMPGEFPTMSDWEHHLGFLLPEVRLKKYLEMRGSDSGSSTMLCALSAFWVGLLYDEISLQNVWNLIADWTEEEREMLWNQVPRSGLNTPFRDGLLKHVAQDVVKCAKDGLERRGMRESIYLAELTEIARTGVTRADKLLEKYYGKWEQSVDPLFGELVY